eukprot:UN20088
MLVTKKICVIILIINQSSLLFNKCGIYSISN